jgi:hypothetical protein
MSKERLFGILQNESLSFSDMAFQLQEALDDYRGSFAAKFFLEALCLSQGIAMVQLKRSAALPSALQNPLAPVLRKMLEVLEAASRLSPPQPLKTAIPRAPTLLPGHVQNNMCGGIHCTSENGEVRTLPLTLNGNSNMILCQACHEHEMAFRQAENKRGVAYPYAIPAWESLEIYNPGG